jgi:hypothetical protein
MTGNGFRDETWRSRRDPDVQGFLMYWAGVRDRLRDCPGFGRGSSNPVSTPANPRTPWGGNITSWRSALYSTRAARVRIGTGLHRDRPRSSGRIILESTLFPAITRSAKAPAASF